MSNGGDVLGYVSMALVPDAAGNISSVPAFLSDGTTISSGWVIPSEPVTIYWANYTGAPCRTGTPYIRSKKTMRVHGVAFWQVGGPGNLYTVNGYDPVDGIVINSISTADGSCAYPNTAYNDLVSLDPTPVDTFGVNSTFPWTISPL